jgi:hypothetical protein
MPAASSGRPSVPIVTATIVIFAPNDRSSHMMRFEALPTKLRFFRMLLRIGIIAFCETVAFSALRFFSTTDKSDFLISSSSYAQLNNITCSSLVAPEHRTQQSAAIQQWRPWEHSTGPKSEEGKARVSRNAYKGGTRARLRELARLLREQCEALKAHRNKNYVRRLITPAATLRRSR